ALHGRHIIHRDLKPSNVMVTNNGHVVILDFGLVAELDRARLSLHSERISGTPKYMAPEQAAGGPITAASDWYAVGGMLYEALAGKPPFAGSMLQIVQDKQRRDAPAIPREVAVPEDLCALAMCLLARSPQERPDALAIAKAVARSPASIVSKAESSGDHLV